MAEVLQSSQKSSWLKWITDFDKQYNLFKANIGGLRANRDFIARKHPELLPRYNQLMQEAAGHQKTLTKLASVRSTVGGWLQSVGQFFGFGDTDDQLGVVWFIPVGIGVAIAGLAAITKFNSESFMFAQTLEEARRIDALPITEQEKQARRKQLYQKSDSGSWFGDGLTGNLKWIALAIAAAVIVPAIFNAMKGR